jgi:hypothetical protein
MRTMASRRNRRAAKSETAPLPLRAAALRANSAVVITIHPKATACNAGGETPSDDSRAMSNIASAEVSPIRMASGVHSRRTISAPLSPSRPDLFQPSTPLRRISPWKRWPLSSAWMAATSPATTHVDAAAMRARLPAQLSPATHVPRTERSSPICTRSARQPGCSRPRRSSMRSSRAGISVAIFSASARLNPSVVTQ